MGLTEFPKKNVRDSSGDMVAAISKKYFASIYLYAIAMYFEMGKDPENKDRVGQYPILSKLSANFYLSLNSHLELRKTNFSALL